MREKTERGGTSDLVHNFKVGFGLVLSVNRLSFSNMKRKLERM